MADLASTDVTITIQEGISLGKVWIEAARRHAVVKIAFGDGALTYPTGGVPLPSYLSFGMVRNLAFLKLIDTDEDIGIYWKYDYVAKTLAGYRAPAQTHGHDLRVIGGQTTTTTNEVAVYGASAATAIFGKEATTNFDILTANSASSGGVLSTTLAVASFTELAAGSYAPAATVLYAEAVGW